MSSGDLFDCPSIVPLHQTQHSLQIYGICWLDGNVSSKYRRLPVHTITISHIYILSGMVDGVNAMMNHSARSYEYMRLKCCDLIAILRSHEYKTNTHTHTLHCTAYANPRSQSFLLLFATCLHVVLVFIIFIVVTYTNYMIALPI